MIIPNHTYVARLIVRYTHEWSAKHMGKEYVAAALRKKYWVVGARAMIKDVIQNCVICKRLYGKLQEQRMANLPKARVVESPEGGFSMVGCDCFGHYYVSTGRRTRANSGENKRWIVLYCSMNMRAVNLEVIHSMSGDSFLQSLTREENRKGQILEMYVLMVHQDLFFPSFFPHFLVVSILLNPWETTFPFCICILGSNCYLNKFGLAVIS